MKIEIMDTGISIFRLQDGYMVSLHLTVDDPYYTLFNKGINELTTRAKGVPPAC